MYDTSKELNLLDSNEEERKERKSLILLEKNIYIYKIYNRKKV